MFYFRAEIEEVQSNVSELETRLEKVRRMHVHPHTLCTTRTQREVKGGRVAEPHLTESRK